MARRFEELIIWQKARRLVGACFDLTELQPLQRSWAFNNQLTSAALSVMNNIAEGFDRGSDKQFAHFLRISKASSGEVRSMFYVMLDRKWISATQFEQLRGQAAQLSAGIQGLIGYLQRGDFGTGPGIPETIRDASEWSVSDLPESFFNMEENSPTDSSSSAARNDPMSFESP